MGTEVYPKLGISNNDGLVIYGPPAHFKTPIWDGIPIPSMPTAIMMVYTSDGFVLASDGKGSGGATGEQKIFDASGPDWCLACGVSGAASKIVTGWDVFKDEYARIVSELRLSKHQNLADYADDFIARVGLFWYPAVSTDPTHLQISIKVQLAGYFKGQPSMAEREIFSNHGGYPPKKIVDFCYLKPGQDSLVGSPRIKRLVLAGHKDFQKFKTVGLTKMEARDPSISLSEAMEAATQYIEACMSEKAAQIDPVCETIGGCISAAVLTPTKGFDWKRKPTNLVL